jgi:hypothetical protein
MRAIAVLCSALIFPGEILSGGALYGQPAPQIPDSPDAAPMSSTELESLVAPIALYPDSVLAQFLAASTYPLEIVEARRWMKQNSGLKGETLVEAAARQDWEPSVQALVVFPTLLQMMDENLKWTTALGNVFLAQQESMMTAIQSLRQKARAAGTLQSDAQQTVEVQQVEGAQAIVIQPTQADVIYIPAYTSAVVFGAPPVSAPYPAVAYPATAAVIAAGALSFSAGVAVGTIFHGWSGGWGWGCNWGPRPALYVNNTFINRYGFRTPPNVIQAGTGAWAHNPYYRGAVPYSSATVANRYGFGRAVTTPYGTAAGVRTPMGGAAAIARPDGAAVGVRTPGGGD